MSTPLLHRVGQAGAQFATSAGLSGAVALGAMMAATAPRDLKKDHFVIRTLAGLERIVADPQAVARHVMVRGEESWKIYKRAGLRHSLKGQLPTAQAAELKFDLVRIEGAARRQNAQAVQDMAFSLIQIAAHPNLELRMRLKRIATEQDLHRSVVKI